MARLLKLTGLALLLGVVVLLVLYGRYIGVALGQAQMFTPPEYDTVAPDLPRLSGSPRVLAFSKTNGFRHHDAIPAARAMIDGLAKQHSWAVFHTENGAVFEPATLQGFDVIILNSCTGSMFTPEQETAFRAWVEQGGGVVALHAAGDGSHKWDWWIDDMIRARFTGHPISQHIQAAVLNNQGVTHPVTAHLPQVWQLADEWYSFAESPRGLTNVLVTIDETSYETEGLAMGDDHPMVWEHSVGRGRLVYSALGHVAEIYDNQDYRRMIAAAVDWVNQQGV